MSSSAFCPLADEDIRFLLRQDEDPRLEFKQEWYDLDRAAAKAEMVKDVLALANCSLRDSASYLVAGIQDRRHGGAIIGLQASLDRDRITQIVQSFANPIPEIQVQNAMVDGKLIGILGIGWTPQHPYFAFRDFERILLSSVFYTRRGGVVGHMTPAEIEAAFRRKGQRFGAPFSDEPLQFGFINTGKWSGPYGPIVRFQNVSEEPIADIQLVFDVRLSRDGAYFMRRPSFNGLTLGPGDSREVELPLRELSFSTSSGRSLIPWTSNSDDRWLEVMARLRYRQRSGYFREVVFSSFVLD